MSPIPPDENASFGRRNLTMPLFVPEEMMVKRLLIPPSSNKQKLSRQIFDSKAGARWNPEFQAPLRPATD